MARPLQQIGALLALTVLASAAQSAAVYALGSTNSTLNTTLVRFDSAAPGAVTTVGAIGGATTQLDGIDFRPADGALYGYNSATGGIYRVDTASGATTLVSTSTTAIGRTAVGIDFNPAADRLRVVTAADNNLRINVATGATLVDGTLAYAAGDANFGTNPNIIEAAYTHNDNNPATGTALYYIDDLLNVLVTTTAPNGGALNTVGALGLDVDEFLGFDIFTDAGGVNSAFASLRVAGAQGLYAINLASGAATLIGAIGMGGMGGMDRLHGLAVATVPEPGTMVLTAAAGLALVGLRRRKGQPLKMLAA